MTTRRAVLLALAMFAGACGVTAEETVRKADPENVPFALLEANAPPLVPPTTMAPSEAVRVCFVREGQLVDVTVPVATPVTLRSALDALAKPPDTAEQLRTALVDTAIVHEVSLGGGIARIDLRAGISTLAGDDQLLAVAQIVCTLTARPGVGQVSFTLEGAPVQVPRGDGSLVDAPVSRDDYVGLFA